MKRLILLILIGLILVGFKTVTVAAKTGDNKGPLSKITFIHYRKSPVKPDWAGKPKPSGAKCYSFLSSGAKWKTTEDYLVNPANSGLTGSFVSDALAAGVAEWERYGGSLIFGSGSLDPQAVFNDSFPDDKNVAVFGPYSDPRVIAVTNVWGYFYGKPSTRELVEWDMWFNTNFNWGDAGLNPALMDLQNIATHELGHSAGLGDQYDTVCSLDTMYGYSTEGEIIKRDLYSGDIAGIKALYQ